MGIPKYDSRFDATFDWAGKKTAYLVRRELQLPPTASVLDVGAGWGKYRDLLPEFMNMDACEVWLPYVIEEKLWERYRKVYTCNILDLILRCPPYDLVIMGDVFEHLTVPEARKVLEYFRGTAASLIIVVPFEYVQGEEEGNPYEVHKQADLNPTVMLERYPELVCRGIERIETGEAFKGLYTGV